MKRNKGYLISDERKKKYWAVVPGCLFLIIVRGVGPVGALLMFLLIFSYDVSKSEKEWQDYINRK